MEPVYTVPVNSSLEFYLFFKATGKPHYLHDLPKHLPFRIFPVFQIYFVPLPVFYPTCLIPSLGTINPRKPRPVNHT